MRPFRSLVLLAAAAGPAVAQTSSATPADTTSHARETRLFTQRDLVAAGVVTVASVALSVFDKDIYRAIADSSVQNNSALSHSAKVFNHFQETWLTVGGLATWGVGRLTGSRSTADIGFHVAEAVFAGSVASQVIRGPLGRARPTYNNGTDQYDFHYFKGFGNFRFRAFPSIHSASGFAAATVISREVQERWPRQQRWVTPLAYTLAATPGLARLYYGQHWASDVVFGAFMGVLAGQKVVTYNHHNPNNRVNRLFLGRAPSGSADHQLQIGIERKF